MGRIFGTDGARGVVGKELTIELAVNIGRAAAQVLAAECGHKPLVIIGKDTRISGDALESAVAAGLCSVGADVLIVGVVPTPAVAFLVNEYNADAGVMLSASHNPYEFNGIKLFGPTGFKLTDQEEELIEGIILDNSEPYIVKCGGELGQIKVAENGCNDYIHHISKHYKGGFVGKVLVDCANGSACTTARGLFTAIGVDADIIYDTPNGININDRCGSTYVERLSEKVVAGGYTLGLAFDGDADRLMAVDEKGSVLDGDFIIAILAQYLKKTNALNENKVVVTTMSNLGFFKLMKELDIKCEITKVGDRYVLERMMSHNLSLGGEQSGHVIVSEYATTGDGQLSAIILLNAITTLEKPLSQLGEMMTKFPQTMLNVTVTPTMKNALDSSEAVQGEINHWSEVLGERGRIVVRPSGTEPFIRVMVEGETLQEIEKIAKEIATAIRQHLI